MVSPNKLISFDGSGSLNSGTPNDLNKFTGHERDQEGGLDLDYMLARNYDPEIGRFYSVDPLYHKYPHVTPYSYTENNPINRTDPDGKSWWGAITGATIEYATQVVTNVSNGGKLDDKNTWTKVDVYDIGVAAAFGAESGGISNIKQAGNVSKLAKLALDVLESAVANVLEEGVKATTGSKTGDFTSEDVVSSGVAGALSKVAGVFGGDFAKKSPIKTQNGINIEWNAKTPNASAKTKLKAAEYGTGTVANANEQAGTNVIQKGIEEIQNEQK